MSSMDSRIPAELRGVRRWQRMVPVRYARWFHMPHPYPRGPWVPPKLPGQRRSVA